MNTTTQVAQVPTLGELLATLPDRPETAVPTRQEAKVSCLAAVAPELAEKVQRVSEREPGLADRALRAALIVLAGDVKLDPRAGFSANGRMHRTVTRCARVRSQTRAEKEYLITLKDGQFSCNCPDANPGDPEAASSLGAPCTAVSRHTCEHILAYLLAAESTSPRLQNEDVASAVDLLQPTTWIVPERIRP